jgi:hypothetical protein
VNTTRGRAWRCWRAAACGLPWLALALGTMPAVALPPAAEPAAPASATPGSQRHVDVWLDLDLPPLATLPRDAVEARLALRQRITRQQDAVMARLAELGASELARVQQVRNAVAVHLPGAALAEARRLPGVLRVRMVRDRRTDTPDSWGGRVGRSQPD